MIEWLRLKLEDFVLLYRLRRQKRRIAKDRRKAEELEKEYKIKYPLGGGRPLPPDMQATMDKMVAAGVLKTGKPRPEETPETSKE